ncbi:yfcZ [Klebsiella pneumoniae subsp. rhinoscleromatis SB3432]|nr:yfcZ [Klebsiella pneumoniae subsp. rhinoscleromatis SB3432]
MAPKVHLQRKSTMSKCSADETPVCCCMDVGTIVDNTDCTASYSRVFANRAEAEQTLAALSEKARNVESEPCQINPTFTDVDGGVQLDIDFVFSCEAESLIFQLGLR